jgi:oxysterol-binding protein 1
LSFACRAHLEAMYNFTELAIQLNEQEERVAPTDSRHRPDQRLMEQALWDEANKEKVRLEDKQRTIRKQRELQNEQLAAENKPQIEHESLWFKKTTDPYTNQPIHLFNNEYWECKKKQDWKRCPDLF